METTFSLFSILENAAILGFTERFTFDGIHYSTIKNPISVYTQKEVHIVYSIHCKADNSIINLLALDNNTKGVCIEYIEHKYQKVKTT